MWRNSLAIVLCTLMALSAQDRMPAGPTVQEQVGKISTGTIVEVKTRLKDMQKVRGRLTAVTAEGFELQSTKGQKIDNVKLSFADVKSVTKKSGGTHPVIWILAGVGIALGVLFAIAAVAVAYD